VGEVIPVGAGVVAEKVGGSKVNMVQKKMYTCM
jgi:hypothetical protein